MAAWGGARAARLARAAFCVGALTVAPVFGWAQDVGVLSPQEVLQSIADNGDAVIDAAAANMAIARARLDEAGAALGPSMTLSATGQFYRPVPERKYPDDNAEAFGMVEVVQPIYDFGQASSAVAAAGLDAEAADHALASARNTVLLEGLALYYDLHASELEIRALYENHTSAYLRWDRAKENLALGRASPVDVAEALTKAEQTRLAYYRERTRNAGYRLRLQELMGVELPEELISPPKPPKAKPAEVDRNAFVETVWKRNPDVLALSRQAESLGLQREGTGAYPSLDAFADAGYSTRDLRGRNEYAVGARLSWPIFDSGATNARKMRKVAEESRALARLETKKSDLRRQAYALLMGLDDAYQRVISARAHHDFTSKNLVRRQQLYAQERVADLGTAMIQHTGAEAELVRATGAFNMVLARLAVLVGEQPGRGLEQGFLPQAVGGAVSPTGGFVPKAGTGFGQSDQDGFKRQDTMPPAPNAAPVEGVEPAPVN